MAPSFFALPLTGVQHPEAFRIQQLKSLKKRKRNMTAASDDEEDEVGQTDGSDEDDERLEKQGTNALSTAASSAHLTTADASQYRLAGHSYDDELPGGRFPHAPLPSSATAGEEKIQEDLAALNPPLYVPNTSSAQVIPAAVLQPATRLRRNHLAVLIGIMHRCLLEGDFMRAGRAWGMLLRMELRGDELDIRAQGRWGLGAEILIRRQVHNLERRPHEPAQTLEDDLDTADANDEADAKQLSFSPAGFEQAREYYERLILQHPFRKIRPHAISSIDFYPAMYGLWIYQIEELFRLEQKNRKVRRKGSESDHGQDDGSMDDQEISGEDVSREEVDRCLKRFEELVARLEELLLSPPYSDSPPLWQLRGMVGLRMADLCTLWLPPERHPDSEDSGDDDLLKGDLRHTRNERDRALSQRQRELGKARSAFQRVQRCGGQVWEGVQDLLDESKQDG